MLTRLVLTRHVGRAVAVLALASWTLAARPVAQQPAPQPPASGDAQGHPVFESRIDSISVDVIVTDKQGRPVTDLKAEDFEVRESGRLQTVQTFKRIDVDASPLPPSAQLDIMSFDQHAAETAREDNRLFVIFLDDYHVRRANGLVVREQLAKFVSELGPRDLVAVGMPMLPVAGMTFSRNHDATAAQVMSFQGRKYDYRPKNAIEAQYSASPPTTMEQMRNEWTLSSLRNLCEYLGTLREGRKTILFVSEGLGATIPAGLTVQDANGMLIRNGSGAEKPDNIALFDSASLLNDMTQVFTVAARTHTSFYTLDPRGMAVFDSSITESVTAESEKRTLTETTDSLRTLAGETDGRAIVNRNDPFPSLRQMVQDSGTYYLLGYTSTLAPRDGKFHPIQVKVNRRDVEVRARKGYWAYSNDDIERAISLAKPPPPPDVVDALDSLASFVEGG